MASVNSEVFEDALEKLRSHDIAARSVDIAGHRDSAQLSVELSAGRRGARSYAAIVRPELGPAAASAVHVSHENTLVVARHISDSAGKILRDRGIDYADAAGNMHLEWERLFIHVQGMKPADVSRTPRLPGGTQSRIFSKSGLRVVFALLAWPDLASAPLRELAAISDTSLGTTHKVVDEMSAAGFLYGARGARGVTRGRDLLTRWTENYVTSLNETLDRGRYVVDDPQWWRSEVSDLPSFGVLLGGEAAASVLDPYLRPATTTLYVATSPAPLLAKLHARRATDDGVSVFVRDQFWRAPVGDDGGPLVPTVLIYADLVASGDPRQREAAERLRENDDRLVAIDRS